jgi:hypothetical protein
MAIDAEMGPPIGSYRQDPDSGRALPTAKFAGCAVKSVVVVAAAALAVCGGEPHPKTAAAAAQTAPTTQGQSAAVADTAPASDGLRDLAAMTFSCPKAGLNAAAREAAKAPSQGTYQFSYFRIVNDAHHSAYEVHFESNYVGEPDLKYCVAMYCQQGWDPNTTEISVSLMGDQRRPAGGAAHGADCGDMHAPAQRAN